jgi:RNA polymerase sigma factor (sigma-70 family)
VNFEREWKRALPKLKRIAAHYAISKDDQDDILADAARLAWSCRHQFDGSNFTNWACRVCQNAARTMKRKTRYAPDMVPIDAPMEDCGDLTFVDVFPCPAPGPLEELLGRQGNPLLSLAFSEATPSEKQVVPLIAQGYKYREVAEILDISLSAVTARFYRFIVRTRRLAA